MDALQVISTALAAIAALLSALSAWTSLRSTQAVEANVDLASRSARYQLYRSFEEDYARQYEGIWNHLGPWNDPVKVDPERRRAVHDLLQTLSSIHVARRLGLIEPAQADYVAAVFVDWLGVPKARAIWDQVFAIQPETWPEGFVEYVNAALPPTSNQP